ncbi:unnamed protein product [Oppiella nova]|uniref:Uncharacterized protein n=1 Tax=Oppiella nova TaxID=334625 RepID=A0A7R9LQB9_9ACAR|nr:unnamed protein product [Oppiella nova]CAG2165567.1 unnamed protein product [Oppiella nova]
MALISMKTTIWSVILSVMIYTLSANSIGSDGSEGRNKVSLTIQEPIEQIGNEWSESESDSRRSSPVKKSTMLLNKLMHALHKALDTDNNEEVDKDTPDPDVVPVVVDNYPMDLHRRGEDRMTRYWRCYFNAVSCF